MSHPILREWPSLSIIGIVIGVITMINLGCTSTHESINDTGEITVDNEMIYPKFRIWTAPANGEEVPFNGASLQWPSEKKATYDVQISTSKKFDQLLIEKSAIPFTIFNPHKKMEVGTWYWQYRVSGKEWNPIDSYLITSSTRNFVTPSIDKMLKYLY